MPVHASSVISTTINTFDSELYTTLTDMENNQYTAGTNGQLTEYQPLFQNLSDDIIAWMNVDRSDKIVDLIQGLYSYKLFIEMYGTDDTLISASDANVLMGMDGVRDDIKNINLLTYTEQFDNAAWTDPLGEWSVIADTDADPLGGTTADEITVDVGDKSSLMRQLTPLIEGETYTYSAWIKLKTGTITGFTVDAGDNGAISVLSQLSTNLTRVSVTVIAGAANFLDMQINFTGASATFAIWGAQLVRGSDTRTYYKNVATNRTNYLTRYDDYPTLTFSGSTITRSTGSWIDDGFADALSITVTGSTSNNTTLTVSANPVTALVLTVDETLTGETDSANVIISGTGARMSDSAMSTDTGLITNAFTSQEDPNTDSLISGYVVPIKGQIFINLFADVTPLTTLTKDQLNTYIFDTLNYRTVFDNMNTGSHVAPTAP